jgi:hypothetical protein
MKDRPQNTPLEEWPPAWLKIECASILNHPAYLMMHDHEKRSENLPVTEDEMRDLIRSANRPPFASAKGNAT